jgi:hypothetical protein
LGRGLKGEKYVATHKVIYTLLDEDFGAASDDMTLWYAASAPITRENLDPPLEFQNRFPQWAKDIPPVRAQPCMQVFPKQPDEHDLFDYKGQLVERTEVFALPTIEPERFLGTEYPASGSRCRPSKWRSNYKAVCRLCRAH